MLYIVGRYTYECINKLGRYVDIENEIAFSSDLEPFNIHCSEYNRAQKISRL